MTTPPKTSGTRRIQIKADDLREMVRKAYLEGHADGVIYKNDDPHACWLDSSTNRKLTIFLS